MPPAQMLAEKQTAPLANSCWLHKSAQQGSDLVSAREQVYDITTHHTVDTLNLKPQARRVA